MRRDSDQIYESSKPYRMKVEGRIGVDNGSSSMKMRKQPRLADSIFPVLSFHHPNQTSSISQVSSFLPISYPHLLDLVHSRCNSVAAAGDGNAFREHSVLVVAGVLMSFCWNQELDHGPGVWCVSNLL